MKTTKVISIATALLTMIISVSCSSNKQEKTLTIAGIGISYAETDFLNNYRESNPDVTLIIKDYEKFGSEAIDKLNIDISQNQAGDILVSSGNIDLDSLVEKNVLLNLEPLFDLEEEMIPAVFNSIKKPDGIYYVYPYFTSECFIAKSKHIKENEWNRDHIISLLRSFSESETDVFGKNPDLSMEKIISQCLINDINNESFSSNMNFYVELIDVCRKLFKISESLNTDYNDDYNYYNDKVICKNEIIFSFNDFYYNEKGYFGDEISVLGSINEQNELQIGAGAFYSIFKNSENSSTAIDFIKEFFKDDYQMQMVYDGMTFPVLQNAFDKMSESTLSWYEYGEDGLCTEKKQYICNMNEKTFDLGYPEKEWLSRYYEKIKNDGCVSFTDPNLRSLIRTSLADIWSSDESSSEIFKQIEKKINLYLSEKQ